MRGHGGHGLEDSMHVTLIKKSTFQDLIASIFSLLEKFTGLLYPAVHAIGMRGNPLPGLELTQQGIKICLELEGKIIQTQVLLKILTEQRFKPFNLFGRGLRLLIWSAGS